MAALLLGPGEPHPRPHDGREHAEESLADRADEGEVALLVAAVEIIEEDPADTARLAPMLQKEVFVAPFLEALVAVAVVGCAGGGEPGMEFLCRGLVGVDRGQIGAAAEPGFAGDDVAGVHMRRRDERRAHMGDERDAARPEARILRRRPGSRCGTRARIRPTRSRC